MSKPHDDSERLDSGAEEQTRSLGGLGGSEVSGSEGDEETREVDTPASLGSGEAARRRMRAGHFGVTGGLDMFTVGSKIGRFVVLGTLGRGGMGTVYEAFDRVLDRRVAVKVLHHDLAPRHQKRLLREAQALAQLSHPNVVQVYEVGELDGQSFVAMELVQGQTLRLWLKQTPRPDWRACVEVYLQAGAGLAAAHEQGLVHCDFKPSNVIVDAKGRVRVLDFGLARAAADDGGSDSSGPSGSRGSGSGQRVVVPGGPTLMTEGGEVMGTPAYMSPEQLEGQEVGARGDQFSFCVALYEAVYGERPFAGRTTAELKAERLAGRIVPAPRATKVPTALRELLLRGLEADPEQRWPSMQTLLEGLRRLVAPRRRRALLTLGGALVVGLALVGAGLAYQAEMGQRCSGAQAQLEGIWDDERQQQVEQALMGTELSYAADTWVRVKARLDQYAEAWVDEHTEVCEATSVRREQSSAVMDLRMACLEQRRVALRETVNVLAEQGGMRVEQAVTLVGSLPGLSRCDDVEALRVEVPPPEDPEAAERVEALRDQLVQARALRNAGAYDQALTEAEGVVTQAEALEYAPLLAEAWLERGEARQELAQYEEAEQDLERAYVLATELEHHEVAVAAVRGLTFVVGHDQARHEEGLLWGKTALALARSPRSEPRDEAIALSVIGVVLERKGALDEAQAYQQRALAMFEQVLDPQHPDIAQAHHHLGNVLWKQGKLDEALSHLRQALAGFEQALGSGHPQVADPLTTIGAVLKEQGNREQARVHLERALALREQALGAGHPDVATSLNNLGIMYKEQGEPEQARIHFERALTILEQSLGPSHPRLAYPLNNIGEVLRAQGKHEEAVGYYERAVGVLEQSLGSNHPDVASSMINLGVLLFQQERYEEARERYQRAYEIQQEALPEDHPNMAWSLLGLAKIGLAQERYEEAREYAERAVAIREDAEVAPELLAEARFVLARILWSDPEQRARARALAEQAHQGWSGAGAGPDRTSQRLETIEQWLTEHPLP